MVAGRRPKKAPRTRLLQLQKRPRRTSRTTSRKRLNQRKRSSSSTKAKHLGFCGVLITPPCSVLKQGATYHIWQGDQRDRGIPPCSLLRSAFPPSTRHLKCRHRSVREHWLPGHRMAYHQRR